MTEIKDKLKECFKLSEQQEKSGIKHKGLLIKIPNQKEAEGYIEKSKRELELCSIYKERGFDYKLPEEWFYILYYCALAILAKFWIETRSQKYTALFLEYARQKEIIDYEEELIQRITVNIKKEEVSDIDKREEARYSSLIKLEKIEEEYEKTMQLCRSAISQAEEIIFSNKEFKIPEGLFN